MNTQIDEFMKTKSPQGVSVKTISRKLGLKRRSVIWYINSSGNFLKVDPIELGSNKTTVNVWKKSL